MSDSLINVSSDKLEHAQKALAGIPGGVEKATKNALHRVGDGLRSDAVNETKQKYHLLPGEIRKHLLLKKATGANQSVSLTATGSRKKLSEYKVTGRGEDIEVAVKKDGMKKLKTGFLMDKGGRKVVYWRPAGENTPAMPVISPSVPQVIKNKETVATMQKQAHERFEKRLDHEILRLMGAFK
ncbi:MAG: phage tail protein [Synergistaceae bacterium]|jgi:hypothetical protein|nr:phage tail protein [Synergistaceae bacterium]